LALLRFETEQLRLQSELEQLQSQLNMQRQHAKTMMDRAVLTTPAAQVVIMLLFCILDPLIEL
jgi:hypothetical protein